MFQPRSSEFEPNVTAIVDHLRAIEKELGTLGQKAGRRVAGNASAAGDQIADAIAPILTDLVDRFRRNRRAAVGGAAKLGNEATRIGSRISRDAARRAADQVAQRPLLTLALVAGIGLLIGAAARRS
ncbi:MAG: hypothetical protein WBF58_16350 [Xanthobacteraceae bacterium]